MSYRIGYSPEAEQQLRALPKALQVRILDEVELQLAYQPAETTKNRKRMRPNPIAVWELRIASARVYYDIVDEPERVVRIRAIGVKEHNEVRIDGEVVDL